MNIGDNVYNPEEIEVAKLKEPTWWILKPEEGFGGEGIKVKFLFHFLFMVEKHTF
jgi:hypothetical protein